QGADHLEGEAAGAEHDRGPELDDRDARLSQDLARLLSALQMLRKAAQVLAQSAKINDALHAGLALRRAENPRGLPVAPREILAAQRVDQVGGGIARPEGSGHGLSV